MNSPPDISLNGWFGSPNSSIAPLSQSLNLWLGENKSHRVEMNLLFEKEPEEWDWSNTEKIGWSLILPDCNDNNDADLATPFDAPEPIRELWRKRGSPPIYRFDLTNDPERAGKLRRHSIDGVKTQDLDDSASAFGIGEGRIPYFLLIVGGPNVIPWSLQRRLNANHAVGRLFDLGKGGLENYVQALLCDWKGCNSEPLKPLIWSTGHDWVTNVMWHAVGEFLNNAYLEKGGEDLKGGKCLIKGNATIANLVRALVDTKPGLIVTTSHGYMDSSDTNIAARVGAPVDGSGSTLLPDQLPEDWQPEGAIWLSVACCSAGTDQPNGFDGLLDKSSIAHQALEAISQKMGRSVAPLPRRLLGAKKPLRAFVGHVEPTFDRVMYDSTNRQYLAGGLVEAFSSRFYQEDPRPIGYCLRPHYQPLGNLYDLDRQSVGDFNKNVPNSLERILDIRLRQRDLVNMMILGDPTVAVRRH